MEIEDLINEHLSQNDLDVRKSRDARFMDQKCTPDVVSIIADCVMNIRSGDTAQEFIVSDIWDSQYFGKHVKAVFNKPSAKNPTTESEYDKFIQQPLRLLAYAQILSIEKRGLRNYYKINNIDLLEYIALKDRNAFVFLYRYFIKVLSDSDMLRYFETYRDKFYARNLTQRDFDTLKHRFQKFIIGNTAVNGELEVNRMFPKILNIYAVYNNLPGSVKGHMGENPFSYSDLMYNRPNWRDARKNKQISRQEAMVAASKNGEVNVALNKYLVQKAINNIKKWHSDSEVKDQWNNGEATQVHHIFPEWEFPQLADYVENLIRLTPTQHYTKAHPSNRTKVTNRDYQFVCLISKSQSIEQSIHVFGERYYRKALFVYVINTGLEQDIAPETSFDEIRGDLVTIYNHIE